MKTYGFGQDGTALELTAMNGLGLLHTPGATDMHDELIFEGDYVFQNIDDETGYIYKLSYDNLGVPEFVRCKIIAADDILFEREIAVRYTRANFDGLFCNIANGSMSMYDFDCEKDRCFIISHNPRKNKCGDFSV